ncbi:hypothetical protein ACFQDZ_05460 [Sulfitobacter pacificus]|uniref:hypothetical protein n=1 Tax=Sulfitobacter pacificus TaxID=1499314 RepID=UPI003610D89A
MVPAKASIADPLMENTGQMSPMEQTNTLVTNLRPPARPAQIPRTRWQHMGGISFGPARPCRR